MRVLFVTASYPTESAPYAGAFVREHARAVSLRDEVAVLHLLEREEPGVVEERDRTLTAGIPTFRVGWRPLPVPRSAFLPQTRAALGSLDALAARAASPRIVHAHFFEAGLPALAIARRLAAPLVVTEHHTGLARGTLPRLGLLKARAVYRRAARVMPVSEDLRRGMEASGVSARFTVVPNAIDAGLFAPGEAPAPGRLLYVGSLIGRKDVGTLLHALALLLPRRPELALTLVGEGPERDALVRLGGELGIAGRLAFRGTLSREEVARAMGVASLLVLPSLLENLPCVLLEAMASGLPCVATRVGGVAEIVTPEVGLLVAPGDPAAMAGAIDAALDGSWDRAALAARANARYGLAAVGERLHGIYEEELRRRGR